MKKAIYSLAFLLVSCSPSTEEKSGSVFLGNAMTMDYKVIIGDENSERKKIQMIIDSTFSEIDAIYNKWNPQSELSSLNKLKAYQKKVLSPELEAFLIKTKEITLLTNGLFDPTVEPLERLWKKAWAEKKVPKEEEIKKILLAVGLDKIVIEEGTFYKTHDQLSLDLGGIAKGFAVDLLTFNLNKAGYQNVFVEWGGEVKAIGEHPDKRAWRIFISRLHDQNPEHAISHVDLKDKAVATSGDYLQNWTVRIENKTIIYSHIFDPKTGYPLEITRSSIASATVLHSSCLMADAIATALMLFPNQEKAKDFALSLQEKEPDMQFWIISREQN
ncbi:MAG TPA: FAD:protein FMN transferase [Parachlamydiaceae bacterium]|nr:FAD:protein FMN transferase [Parachlamydiaceae bacterium]